MCTPEGAELDVDVVENEDGTFDIFYTAPQPGEYVICVRFGGEHIPNSPFQVTVSDGDVSVVINISGRDPKGETMHNTVYVGVLGHQLSLFPSSITEDES